MSQTSKIALVTGAGSGIGRSCAQALLNCGWTVVFAGRRLGVLEAALRSASLDRDRAVAIACDVGSEESVKSLFSDIHDRFGRLDLLFNNAGISAPAKLPDELEPSVWRDVVDTNLNGAFFCLAQAFKLMRSQSPRGGRIINNGSISAHVPRPGTIAYAATKHAITGLTRAAALDGRPFDIAVGQIDIGNVATEINSPIAGGQPEPRMEMSAVTETFMAMANLPLTANVLFMTVMATQMPYVGRG